MRARRPMLEANLGFHALISAAMTTPPGQDPGPSPTRGGPARPAPQGADSSWPPGGTDGRGRGPARPDSDPWGPAPAPDRGRIGRPGGDRARERPSGGAGRPGPGDRAPAAGGAGGTGRGYLGAGPGFRAGGRRDSGRGDSGRGDSGGRDDWGNRGLADGPAEPPDLRRATALRWLGTLSTRVTIYILLGAALLGVLGTLLTGREPGGLLSFFIIFGSVIAALGIRRRSLYLLIPLPALTFFICAVLTGAAKDASIDTSKTELGVSFLQWIASVFFAMCAATILVLVIGAGRWLLSRQLVTGQSGLSADAARGAGPRVTRAPRQRADRDPRPPRDQDPLGSPWTRDDPGGQRGNRQGDARAPWGDRQPPGVQPPDRPVPSFQPIDRSQPGTRSQPGGQPPNRVQPGAQPPDRGKPGGRRPGSGAPDDPATASENDPGAKRDPWDRRGSRGTGNRERPAPRDPWGTR
jgi:hypothetical protein